MQEEFNGDINQIAQAMMDFESALDVSDGALPELPKPALSVRSTLPIPPIESA